MEWMLINSRGRIKVNSIIRLFRRKPKSNLVMHAKRELEIIGEEPDVIRGYLKVIQAFADMNHSGGSASVAIPVINELLQFHNLAPLTNNPAEWVEVFDNTWQNSRMGEAFSEDGGRTYYLLGDDRKHIHTSLKG
jgi:hypothetical protein